MKSGITPCLLKFFSNIVAHNAECARIERINGVLLVSY